jgi:hypothetical protein
MPRFCAPCFTWHYNDNHGHTEVTQDCLSNHYTGKYEVPLTIFGFGDYYMTVDYDYDYNGRFCTVTSPILSIREKDPDECGSSSGCDDAEIENCYIKCCQVYFDQIVRVCNISDRTITYNQLTASNGYTVTSWWPNPLTLMPGQCANIFITVRIDNINQQTGTFTLSSTSNGTSNNNNCETNPPCDLTFPININLNYCAITFNECDLEYFNMYFDATSSPQGNLNFSFNIGLPNNTVQLISFWSVPQNFLINYNFNPPNNISGNATISYSQLWEMMCNDDEICIYAIICLDNDKFCKVKACISAREIYDMLPAGFKNNKDNSKIKGKDKDKNKNKSIDLNLKP